MFLLLAVSSSVDEAQVSRLAIDFLAWHEFLQHIQLIPAACEGTSKSVLHITITSQSNEWVHLQKELIQPITDFRSCSYTVSGPSSVHQYVLSMLSNQHKYNKLPISCQDCSVIAISYAQICCVCWVRGRVQSHQRSMLC